MARRIPMMGDLYQRTTAGRPRIEPLTGLRWCAALAVFLSHNIPRGGTPHVISTFFSSGYMGVTVFFVLSGFVLTVTYGNALADASPAKTWNYAVARTARVMPLYLLVLLFVVAGGINASPLSKVWWHFLAIQAWSGDVRLAYSWNGPGWSVGVEFFLYAMFPMLILLTRFLTSTRRVVVLAILVVAAMTAFVILFHHTGYDGLPPSNPASAHRWIYRSPLLRLGDFTLGICGAMVYARERHRKNLVKAAPFVAAAMSVLIVAFMMTAPLSSTSFAYDLAYAAPGAVLILGLALSPDRGIARLLGSVTLVALGELSYGFYLLHEPIGTMVIGGRLSNGFTPVGVGFFVVGLLILVVLSWALHVSFERPARVFLRKRLSISPARRSESAVTGETIGTRQPPG